MVWPMLFNDNVNLFQFLLNEWAKISYNTTHTLLLTISKHHGGSNSKRLKRVYICKPPLSTKGVIEIKYWCLFLYICSWGSKLSCIKAVLDTLESHLTYNWDIIIFRTAILVNSNWAKHLNYWEKTQLGPTRTC